jgi:hypothetical protein
MKKFFFLLQSILLLCFISTLFLSGLEISGTPGAFKKFNYPVPVYNGIEEFDPSLQSINSLNRLFTYCDSLYDRLPDKTGDENHVNYISIVRNVIRKRFYHGYSTFGFGNNYVALIGENFYRKGISSVVLPDEILKYPFAACSQQAILVMEVLKRKGFSTRKVGFPPVEGAGHFCVEVYYNNSWHFIDTDMEPDLSILAAYNFPDANFLANHKNIVGRAYYLNNPERTVALFSGKIFYGTPDKFPAIIGRIYQKFSWFLSYTLWLFFGIGFILVNKKYNSLRYKHVWNSGVYIPSIEGEGSFSYYSKTTA